VRFLRRRAMAATFAAASRLPPPLSIGASTGRF
jgi:hypothetical protein